MRFSCSMRLEAWRGYRLRFYCIHLHGSYFAQPSRQTAIQDSITETRFGFGVLRSDSATPVSALRRLCAVMPVAPGRGVR
ncbi:hypothetical protein JCM18916_2858 [Cutibacterium acnes JCM 18916]|nr:hypothetical protein JCM18916_2858 [Cutibacterium acnes JCM 18916]